MSDLVFLGPSDAVSRRAPDVRDLAWMRNGDRFELAVDVVVPEERQKRLKQGNYAGARYEVSVGLSRDSEELAILAETFWLTTDDGNSVLPAQREMFPAPPVPPTTIIRQRAPRGWKKVVNKVEESGNDYFSSETSGWHNLFGSGLRNPRWPTCPRTRRSFRWRRGSRSS